MSDPNKYFSKVINSPHSAPSFTYLYDPNAVITGNSPPQTGAFRAASVSDFAANISVSGLNLTVGAVSITGSPIVTIATSTYGPSFNIVTAGQITIPQNSKSYSVSVISGQAYINGTGPFDAGVSLNGGGYDGKVLLASAVVVGGTGGKIIVYYET